MRLLSIVLKLLQTSGFTGQCKRSTCRRLPKVSFRLHVFRRRLDFVGSLVRLDECRQLSELHGDFDEEQIQSALTLSRIANSSRSCASPTSVPQRPLIVTPQDEVQLPSRNVHHTAPLLATPTRASPTSSLSKRRKRDGRDDSQKEESTGPSQLRLQSDSSMTSVSLKSMQFS
jgi:hypothetical protein